MTAPPNIDHVVGISWPRSGHHLLVRLLKLYFGDRFIYCVPKAEKPGCCGTIPCQKRDSVHFTKNHDFQLDVAQVDGLKYLIQYREFVSSVVSNFELYIRNGGEDSMRGFQRFASSEFDRYLSFQKKWVFSDFGKGQFLLDYDMLVSKPGETLARIVKFFAPESTPDPERIEWAVSVVAGEKVERRRIIPKPKAGVHARRDVREFRFHDQKLFETLENLSLRTTDVNTIFRKLLNRNANPDEMLELQAYESPEALEDFVRRSEEFRTLSERGGA